VNSLADTNSRDGVITLREAIALSNGTLAFGTLDVIEMLQVTQPVGSGTADAINFSIAGGGPHTIVLVNGPLNLTDGNTTIDGYSQAGSTLNNSATAFNATIKLVIDGSDTSISAGSQSLAITSNGNIIRGFGFQNANASAATAGIHITSAAATGNRIQGCVIGLNAAGTAAAANGLGIKISASASGNFIGGTALTDRNVISGNTSNGVYITSSSTTNNRVLNNLIGLNSAAVSALGNGSNGVRVDTAASGNMIGDPAAGGRNVISGNTSSGVVVDGTGTSGNVVSNNYIGLNAAGTAAVANTVGVTLSGTANANTVGGVNPGEGNVISGNATNGITLISGGTTTNLIQGNNIGTDPTGSSTKPNGAAGVLVTGSANGNTIGGTAVGSGNLISGNTTHGIQISSSTTTTIQGNIIGLNKAGTLGLPNLLDGILIQGGSASNTIGGNTLQMRNYIAGHTTGNGIRITGAASTSNSVQGNYIGLTLNGTAALPNAIGIRIDTSANANSIGGSGVGQGNVISGNTTAGISISTLSNSVHGNLIGTDPAGSAAIGNADGVQIATPASSNNIGGTNAGEGNLISGNGNGVLITGAAASSNLVRGNKIGTNSDGTAAVANTASGVRINTAINNTIGGNTVADRNLISGNGAEGVLITGVGSSGNGVAGNLIGTTLDGGAALGNAAAGVRINSGAASNTIGGTAGGAGNLISGNSAGSGILIQDSGTTGNIVRGNTIGLDLAGGTSLPNNTGVSIQSGATSNSIGGAVAGSRNVISGNTQSGVEIKGSNSNTVQGNYIGTDAAGTTDFANLVGVTVDTGGSSNGIGGTALNAGNLISGNTQFGVKIVGPVTTANLIEANKIGTDAAGSAAIPNGTGVGIQSGAVGNIVGGSTSAKNLISGNTADGINISGVGTNNNIVRSNWIGTDGGGSAALGNGSAGVRIDLSATGTRIGGGSAGQGNVISGNLQEGVKITSSNANLVDGNYIGTDSGGTSALPNDAGISLASGSLNNQIGSGARNVISGNVNQGILITGASNGTIITGNFIGTDVSGGVALSNGTGVSVGGSSTGTMIGLGGGGGNVISGNAVSGIEIVLPGSTMNSVLNNIIGLTFLLDATLANGDGVVISGNNNNVGSAVGGEANVIAGNTGTGVIISGDNNSVFGNFIGTDSLSSPVYGNNIGVDLNGATNSKIGGPNPGERNIISGNGLHGVLIGNALAQFNLVQGNYIGTDAAGSGPLANVHGVFIYLGATNNTIGGTGAQRNIISANSGAGLVIDGATTTNNSVQGNYIGLAASGTLAVGNDDGILITNGAQSNTIGGSAATANVISGNTNRGIKISAGSTLNAVLSNIIGLDAAGALLLGTNSTGISIDTASTSNSIGDGTAGGANVISGNVFEGVLISDSGSSNNTIQRNFIGTNAAGTAARANDQGVVINNGATSNSVLMNTLSGNVVHGVFITGAGTSANIVRSNFIGTNSADAILGNSLGIVLDNGATNNIIGGIGAGNVISGNGQVGLTLLTNVSGTIVQGNKIGTNAAGTVAVRNNTDGVEIADAPSNIIGGTSAGAGNLISGNTGSGLVVSGSANGNLVHGNLIGTNAAGTTALANGAKGVFIFLGASNNQIGGVSAGMPNTIAFNISDGVTIGDSSGTDAAAGNAVLSNSIHSNGGLGIELVDGTGVTVNDAGDLDAVGGNRMQNFPVLSKILISPIDGRIFAIGTLDSMLSPARIQIFNSDNDVSGNGEGRSLALDLASVNNGAFQSGALTPSSAVTAGDKLSATATTADGTSEFSVNQMVVGNVLPIAAVGADQNGLIGTLVTLDGSASNDSDAAPLVAGIQSGNFIWTQTSGPAVTLSNPASAGPSFTPTAGGTYRFSLVVSDGLDSSTNLAQMRVDVPFPPTILSPLTASGSDGVAFTYSISATGTGTITFSTSALPAGLTLAGNTISGTPTFAAAGTTNVTLTATSIHGVDTKTLALTIAGVPPVFSSPPTPSVTPATVTQGVNFTAATNVPTTVFTWNFGDGSATVTGASVSHTYSAAGNYMVTVSAAYPNGPAATSSFVLPVTGIAPGVTWNAPADISYPTALSAQQLNATAVVPGTFVYNPPLGTVLEPGAGQILSATLTPADLTQFAVSTSTVLINVVAAPALLSAEPNPAEPAELVTFSVQAQAGQNVTWDFGDGATGSGAQTTHAYAVAGFYTASATLTTGATTVRNTLTVEVSPLGSRVIEDVIISPNPADISETITFTAKADSAARLVWNFGDGSATVTGAVVQHKYAQSGDFSVAVSAFNAAGTLVGYFVSPVFVTTGIVVSNIDDGATRTSPLDGLTVTVSDSANGAVTLDIKMLTLTREKFSIKTNFGLPGRSVVAGSRPSARFTQPGLNVATVTATEKDTRLQAGRARKTIPISNKELGMPAEVPGEPSSRRIVFKSIKGTFAFAPGSALTSNAFAAKSIRQDIVTMSASIELPPALPQKTARSMEVAIGNVIEKLSLDPKGKAKTATAIVKVNYPKPKPNDTSVRGNTAKITIRMKQPDLPSRGFDTEGITAKPPSGALKIQSAILIAGVTYSFDVPVTYKTNKKSTSGRMAQVKLKN